MPDNFLPHYQILASQKPGARTICASDFLLVSCVPHSLAFTIVGRGPLGFLPDPCSPPSELILNVHSTSKLGQPQVLWYSSVLDRCALFLRPWWMDSSS